MIINTIRSAVDFYTQLPRYQEIVRILFKYGFADVLRLVALQRILKIEDAQLPARKSEILSKPLPVRFRLALEELGPTFIKFGQVLSSRRDLITDEYFEQLVRLQDDVPPFPYKEVEKILDHEFERPINEVFSSLDHEPIAGASIAQVHKGVLLSGETVAVKVQRPDIEKKISLDLSILHDFASFLDKHVPEISVLNPVGVVEEFSETLMKELDFLNEAINAERFKSQFEGNSEIRIPTIYRSYSTSKVLVMDFIRGLPINKVDVLRENDIDPVDLSEQVTDLIYEQIFTHGFFHADPHPGNMTVLQDGAIGLYDFGMMGSFTPEFRESVAMMIVGLAEKDHQQTMRAILDMSDEGFVSDPRKMLDDVEDFSDQHLNQPLRDIRLGYVLNRLLDLLRDNHLRMKSSFYLGVKALAQVEDLGQVLNPDLNFIKLGEPYAMRLIRGKYEPLRVFKILQRLYNEMVDFLGDFPHDFRTFYNSVKAGKLNLPLEHKIDPKGFEPLRTTLDSIANRLANAILTASVLICSSILILSRVPPRFQDVSIIGMVGLIFGAFMCIRLVVSIWRHGGL